MKLSAPVKLRRTVKNRVDRPIIAARVPSMEARSFHRLMSYLPQRFERDESLYSLLFG